MFSRSLERPRWLPYVAVWGFCAALLVRGVAGAQEKPSAGSTLDTGKVPQSLTAGEAAAISPAQAYLEAIRPVEITKRSITNWSPVEQAALALAIKRGTEACAARPVSGASGAALVDLGRLCALGLMWQESAAASEAYLHGEESPKKRAAEAYALLIDAQLHLKDEPGAVKSARSMEDSLPYSNAVGEATGEVIDYAQLLFPADALLLAEGREAAILNLLQGSSGQKILWGENNKGAEVPDRRDLYREGLRLAELQQLMGKEDAAREARAVLDAVVPSSLSADDAAAIVGMRVRYSRLGKRLEEVPVMAWEGKPNHALDLKAHPSITALLLFPDWCIQCVRLAQQMPRGLFNVLGHEAYAYGLVVPSGTGENVAVSKDLADTASFAVTPSILNDFNATDVPLLIMLDKDHMVRLITVADESAFVPGSTVDSAVGLLGKLSLKPSIKQFKSGIYR